MAAARINSLMKRFYDNSDDITTLEKLAAVLRTIKELPLELDMWKAQNMCFSVWKNMYDRMNNSANQNDQHAKDWIKNFTSLAEYLEVKPG